MPHRGSVEVPRGDRLILGGRREMSMFRAVKGGEHVFV